MAGHSKWSNIKHKKARMDEKRGKEYTKLAKELTIAARMGGGDPEMNSKLKLTIQKAKEINMPNDNINRAIKRVPVSWKVRLMKSSSMKGMLPAE